MEKNASRNLEKFEILPLKEERKVLLKDVNNFFICRLCGGYLIDATGLVECFHTYCRSCIVQFLQKSTFCPVCEVQVNKTKPLQSLRPDAIIQRLIYKTVPGLYKSELLRRKHYLNDLETNDIVLSDDESGSREYYFDPEEPISISLEYLENDRTNNNQADGNEDLGKFQKNEDISDQKSEQITYKRYLQCPAVLKIKHIYKFIKLKYNLKKNHEVEILYGSTKLPSFFSLMDTAYTFSWKRDNPMRLCYQIFERTIVQVPLTVENKTSDNYVPVKNDFVTNSSSLSSSDTSKSEEEQSYKSIDSELNSTAKSSKRKSDTNTKKWETESADGDKVELLEPSIKIPRISCDAVKDVVKEEEPEAMDTSSLVSVENDLKVEVKTPSVDSGLFSDDFVKYEQDIEEVDGDDNDDDDDDRLRISQLSEEDTQDEKTEDTSEQLVIDTSDFENSKEECKEEKQEDKKTKYKRKSKKSKHHHHHKHHHHRHHDRKKAAPQATILHSPDTDIMKLKVKLNNVQPDTKYHKQGRRKRKKSTESYFSSYSSNSSASSVIVSSPDTNSGFRADDDSLHSHISEVSAESMDTNSSKEEPNSTTKVETRTPVKPAAEKPCEKHRSPTSKEKLLEMRSFRPKSIAVVKPEENSKVAEVAPKNDNNNNDKLSVQVIEINDKPKPVSTVLRPTSSSSITVSKITAAEKMMMEKEKKMNGSNDDRPSLEITLVTEPSKATVSAVSSTTFTDISSGNKGNKTPYRTMKPVPALVQLKSNEPTIPKSLTIFPHSMKNAQRPIKSNIDTAKKINDVLAMKTDGVKQSVTISLSGNHFENDTFPGVLDLSGKTPSKYPNKTILNVNRGSTMLNKKPGMRPNGIATCYSPVRRMSPPVDNKCLISQLPASDLYSASKMNIRYPLAQSAKNQKISLSPSQPSLKSQVMARPPSNKLNKTANIPPLAEIRIGPVSSSSDVMHKPRPNQNVRNIPNPSSLMHRHQPLSNGIPVMNASPISMMNRLVSTPCSFTNMKKNGDKCLQALTEGYLDYSNVMVTK